jgi:hypothetical protein
MGEQGPAEGGTETMEVEGRHFNGGGRTLFLNLMVEIFLYQHLLLKQR